MAEAVKIKLCGLSRLCDIETVNVLMPDYIGFVFAKGSRRYVSREQAALLKEKLHPSISAVGVFVDEDIEIIAEFLECGLIDIAQLHGKESEEAVRQLKKRIAAGNGSGGQIIKAFRIDTEQDIEAANKSSADYVLLDSGMGGTGTVFDWNLLTEMKKPYFLAGGLTVENVGDAVVKLHPYAVDVSSGIETDGYKDKNKMAAFVEAVRKGKTNGGIEDQDFEKRKRKERL